MNDSKQVKQSHTPEQRAQYYALCRHWSELINSEHKHDLQSYHHLLYAALCHRDWRKAFSPVRRASKLANGRRPYDSAVWALYVIGRTVFEERLLAPFGGLVTPEMLAALRLRLPDGNAGNLADALPDTPYLEVSDDAASAA
jgi:hypothetical protein